MSCGPTKLRTVTVNHEFLLATYRNGDYRDTMKVSKRRLFLGIRLRRAFRRMERLEAKLLRLKRRHVWD